MVPIKPPKTIADLGLLRPIDLATIGVIVITNIDLTKPAAILSAITSLLAPIADPVTGPTTKVTVPAPMVVMLLASSYPNKIATMEPRENDKITPKNKETIPTTPEVFKSLNFAPYAVATIAKSLSIDPPRTPTPDKIAISATPLSPS